jgi:hypothetical protein
MFSRFVDGLFGCWHTHYSFPVTVRDKSKRVKAAIPTGTYVVCTDCGKELPYDWREMRVLWSGTDTSPSPVAATSLVTKEAA